MELPVEEVRFIITKYEEEIRNFEVRITCWGPAVVIYLSLIDAV